MTPDRAAWLAWRRGGVGGSDLGAIFNDRPYGCARRLWGEKLELPPDYPREDGNLFTDLGARLEDLVAQAYAAQTGRLVNTAAPFAHPDRPWERVNVDRRTVDSQGQVRVLEIKAMNGWLYRKVKREGPKAAHLRQVQWGIHLHDDAVGGTFAAVDYSDPRTLAHVLGADVELPLLTFDLPADRELIIACRREAATFWRDAVLDGHAPPPLPDPNDTRCQRCEFRRSCRGLPEEVLAARGDAELADASGEVALQAALGLYTEARLRAEDAKAELKETQDLIRGILGDREAVRCGDVPIYHREQPGRRSWNTKVLEGKRVIEVDRSVNLENALKAVHRARITAKIVHLGETYYTKGKPSRPLRIFLPQGGKDD